jgi:hypothetical protein
MSLQEHYIRECSRISDIYEHLPTLFEYASKCERIVECGVRIIVSSYAFALGLKGKKNTYTLIDTERSANVSAFLRLCDNEGINASFYHGSDLEYPPTETDLLFIDTWHVYAQLKRELAHWHSSVKKYIILHDTTVDEWQGETIRMKLDINKQHEESGFPIHEILRGLWPAVEEFLREHPEWTIERRYTNNNGLTVLARTN